MIKKNTKIVFEDGKEEELDGGMPLTKGEVIHFHKKGVVTNYLVKDKIIDCFMEGKDQIVNIVNQLDNLMCWLTDSQPRGFSLPENPRG